jgi:hypothetical protein
VIEAVTASRAFFTVTVHVELSGLAMVVRVVVAPQHELVALKRLQGVRHSCESTTSTSVTSVSVLSHGPKRSRPRLPANIDGPSIQSEAVWLFELHSVSTLPIVDLERTLLSVCGLPKAVHDSIALRAYAHHRNLYALVRLALLAFTLLVFVRTNGSIPALLTWLTVGFAMCFAAAPLLVLVALSALDVVKMLLTTYECFFISSINTLHWVCVAAIVGAPRSLLCGIAWLSIQSVAMLDANFRTFSATSKAAIACIPLLLAFAVACALGLVSDATFTLLSARGGFYIDTGSVVVFTSSTLALFMAKKVYVTRHQLQECELSLARFRVVPCVVLKARLALRPWRSGRRAAMIGSANLRAQSNMRRLLSATRQPLRGSHHWSTTFVIDARRTLLPLWLSTWFLSASELRFPKILSLFVAVAGAMGFVSSVVVWFLLFLTHPHELVEAKWVVGIVAVGGSHTYVMATYLLSQRDLLLALMTNFDLMFTAFQCQALALVMMDMLRWRPHDCSAVIVWWLWFNWLLLHDALTPPVRQLLRFHRRFALCVVVWVLAVAVTAMALLFISDGPEGEKGLFTDRQVWSFHWRGGRSFELHTKDFAAQRVATIVGWSTRLVFELARAGRHEELLFIRQPVEYSCPVPQLQRSSTNRFSSRSSARTRSRRASLTTHSSPGTRQVDDTKVVPFGSSDHRTSGGC